MRAKISLLWKSPTVKYLGEGPVRVIILVYNCAQAGRQAYSQTWSRQNPSLWIWGPFTLVFRLMFLCQSIYPKSQQNTKKQKQNFNIIIFNKVLLREGFFFHELPGYILSFKFNFLCKTLRNKCAYLRFKSFYVTLPLY